MLKERLAKNAEFAKSYATQYNISNMNRIFNVIKANKKRWAKVPKEQRSAIMKRVVKSKWDKMSKEERAVHAYKMRRGIGQDNG